MKEDVKMLIEYIFNKFYLELVNFMHARYDKLLAKGIAEQLNSDGYI